MPVIVFANPKGGSGKSTAALLLATQLALETKVVVVDADIRRRIGKWSKGGNCPDNLMVLDDIDEENVLDRIDEAAKHASVVIVDLEGTASKLVLLAISQADLVVIPLQDSAPDADEAGAVLKVLRQQERLSGRTVPHVIVRTRTSAAYQSKIMRYILEQLAPAGARVLDIQLIERQAFKSVWVYECPLEQLPTAEVAGVERAVANAQAYATAIVQCLKEVA